MIVADLLPPLPGVLEQEVGLHSPIEQHLGCGEVTIDADGPQRPWRFDVASLLAIAAACGACLRRFFEPSLELRAVKLGQGPKFAAAEAIHQSLQFRAVELEGAVLRSLVRLDFAQEEGGSFGHRQVWRELTRMEPFGLELAQFFLRSLEDVFDAAEAALFSADGSVIVTLMRERFARS